MIYRVLPDSVLQKLVNNINIQHLGGNSIPAHVYMLLDDTKPVPSEQINNCIDWDDTVEGYDYWESVHEKVLKNETEFIKKVREELKDFE